MISLEPASMDSCMDAAILVAPLALSVLKQKVSLLFGRLYIKDDMSTHLTALPSSALMLTASLIVTTPSLPSLGT